MSDSNAFIDPPLIGYVTPLRGRPGQALQFKISSVNHRPFKARTVRIDCGDPNPQGPGMKLPPVDFGLPDREYDGMYQETTLGSHGCATLAPLPADEDIVFEFEFQPWLLNEQPQMVTSLQSSDGKSGIGLVVKNGSLRVGVWTEAFECNAFTDNGFDTLFSPDHAIPLVHKRWYQGRLLLSRASITISLAPYWRGTPCGKVQYREISAEPQLDRSRLSQLIVAARLDGISRQWHFNGRIGNLAMLAGMAEQYRHLDSWDVAVDVTGFVIPNASSSERPLTLFNAPMRAVQGLRWRGDQMLWKTDPAQYSAIHFHADDLGDCEWETSLELVIPESAESGVYGLVIENDAGADTIPFFVLPAKSGPHAKVAYLASTLTYVAYGNHARNNFAGDLEERVAQWDAYPYNPDRVTRFGFSTYNRHPDGHGISLSSRLRPLLTMRPGFLTFCDAAGSGLRHFPADSHLTDWLIENDIKFDVITDEDLNEEGPDILAPYSVLLTGSHPEYHTLPMLEALMEFRRGGGHLAYLGANGFYWKIALGGPENGLLEVRRAEGGIRAWASEPGEYYHQLDGEYGGLWRRNGLPPQTIGSVGFSVQGLFEGSGYRRTAESREPDVSWLFDNVSEETFGDYGLSGGGAAGFELDQVDAALGTPEGAVVIAVSEKHGPSFKESPEEILTWTLPGITNRPYPGIRAHMAYTPPKDGYGSIFASGSITFLGSLSHNNYDNAVSRILSNYISKCLLADGDSEPT